MSTNLIPIKNFLGKYYPEISYTCSNSKYKDTGLAKFLEQRFIVQGNKAQMIVDPGLTGLVMTVAGNEIHISKELYDHPHVVVTNSIESQETQLSNPKSLYDPGTVQTVAYLICQNITTLTIVGEIDEPIYVRYRADYECFYSSIVTFEVNDETDVEIVEEIESCSALNVVTNYILHPLSKLNLRTVYQNNIAGLSFTYRNIFSREKSEFTHVVLGKGSSEIIDETKIRHASGSTSEFMSLVDSDNRNFHTVLTVEPAAIDYRISVDFRSVLSDSGRVTFYPEIIGQQPVSDSASISITSVTVGDITTNDKNAEIQNYISPIADRAILERMTGVKRFYDSKSKFLATFYK